MNQSNSRQIRSGSPHPAPSLDHSYSRQTHSRSLHPVPSSDHSDSRRTRSRSPHPVPSSDHSDSRQTRSRSPHPTVSSSNDSTIIGSRNDLPRRDPPQSQRNKKKPEKWKWIKSRPSSYVPPYRQFTGNSPGPKGIAVGVTDPLACFHLFLPHETYDELVKQTNLYADQQRALKGDTTSFVPITKPELMAFIGINIAMGVVSLPNLKHYWTTDPILSHSWFGTIMSRNRFSQILRYFHIADNTSAPNRSDPGYNKLWKIQPLITALQLTCAELYSPHRQLSIDESIIGTKCRLSFIQYMKAKPTKWGVKVWICADSTNGYISSFEIYTGKDPANPLHPKGLAYDVVMHLLENYYGKGYFVFTDNFYTSPILCKDLIDKKIYLTGTVRKNRKEFPEDLAKKSKSAPGDHTFCFHEHITAVRWFDNKDVFVMSTICSDELTTVKRRRKEGGIARVDVSCPQMIADYNKHMGGVDLADQSMCYYSVGRKNMKWWRKIVWRLHDHAINNAYVIYRENSPSKLLTNLQFRLKLAHSMTEPLVGSRVIPTRAPVSEDKRLMGKHFPYRTGKRRRCVVCAYKKVSPNGSRHRGTKTHIWCPKCEKHMCVGKCFELFHTRTYYRNY